MERRAFLKVLTAGAVLAAPKLAAQPSWERLRPRNTEWWHLYRPELNHAEFRVLQRGETELPHSSPILHEDREGLYVCAGCSLPLFRSEWKVPPTDGRPAFQDVIGTHVGFRRERRLLRERTEYHCARCGGHQGYILADSRLPTRRRYWNNGHALDFRPA